jgi:plastocyanin
MNHPRSVLALSIFALLVVIYGITLLVIDRTAFAPVSPQQAPRPAPSAAVLAQLATSPAFQYLVSYTDTDFVPHTLTVKKGETIRFINNSHKNLWIASSSTPLYPPEQNGCGSSALDSCKPIPPGGFWEFTFNVRGTWQYANTLKQADTATVTVK